MNKGFSLLEGIIVLAVVALAVVVITGEIIYSHQVSARSANISRATSLATEGIEAVRNIRTANFFDLEDGSYGLALVDGQWSLALGVVETIDDFFQREIIIFSPDTNRRQIEVAVSWLDGEDVKLATEFRNWLATVEDWTSPQYDGDFDMTAQNSGSNNHKVRSVLAKGNFLFIGNDQSAGKEFLIFDISKAPQLFIKGTVDLTGSSYDISIFQNFAFIASSANDRELQIVNFSNISYPSFVNYFDLSGNDDALSNGVNDDGNLLIVGRVGGGVYVFNIAVLSNPVLIGQIFLPGSPDINDLVVAGSDVFIAAGDGTLRVVDISEPTLPNEIAVLSLPGCDEALSLDEVDNRFYIGCSGDNNDSELFIGSVNNPAAPILLSTADVGDSSADVNHISFASTDRLAFLLTGDTAKDFQIWDVSNELAPFLLSLTDLNGSPSQADYSPLAQKMFVGLTSNPEIQIVAPELIYE
ncbi:MAG: hypothetical protein ABH822_01110 [Patescibacteria group bacterium]